MILGFFFYSRVNAAPAGCCSLVLNQSFGMQCFPGQCALLLLCHEVACYSVKLSFVLHKLSIFVFPYSLFKVWEHSRKNKGNGPSNRYTLHLAWQAFISWGFCTRKTFTITQLNGNKQKGQFLEGILIIWITESWLPNGIWGSQYEKLHDEGWCIEKKCHLENVHSQSRGHHFSACPALNISVQSKFAGARLVAPVRAKQTCFWGFWTSCPAVRASNEFVVEQL